MVRPLQNLANSEVFRGSVFRVQEGGFSSAKVFLPNTEHRTLNTRFGILPTSYCLLRSVGGIGLLHMVRRRGTLGV
jgi:hypothetical protein